jgi:hypothetical protein
MFGYVFDFCLIFFPIIGYVFQVSSLLFFLFVFSFFLFFLNFALPQYRRIKLEKRDSFSTYVSFILIVSNILRIFFYWVAPFDFVYVLQAVVMIVVQLVLLELITRVRREQRMLPSSLFLRISFRWKNLQRYFWQWDDFPSYCYFLGAMTAGVGLLTLVGQYIPWYAEGLGFVSLFMESMLAVPQFLRNRQEGVEGLSWILVGSWTVGDVAKTIFFAIHPDLPRQFLMCGLIQILVDGGIIYQMWAYRRQYKSHEF